MIAHGAHKFMFGGNFKVICQFNRAFYLQNAAKIAFMRYE